jgi:hypothetical protein
MKRNEEQKPGLLLLLLFTDHNTYVHECTGETCFMYNSSLTTVLIADSNKNSVAESVCTLKRTSILARILLNLYVLSAR